LFPWQELAETYAPQINTTIGVPDKLERLVFGSLCTKQPLWLTDEETVHSIREKA